MRNLDIALRKKVGGKFSPAILGILLMACLFAFASQANALIIGDASYLGFVESGEPASPTNEVLFINTLIDLAPNGSLTIDLGLNAHEPHTFTRSSNTLCYNTCVDATLTGADTGNAGTSVDLGSGFLYLLAKYDGPNGGDAIWYVSGLTGTITIPSNLSGTDLCKQTDGCGLSHWALYNPGGGPGNEVPEPSALLLFGSGLLGTIVAKRRLGRKSN